MSLRDYESYPNLYANGKLVLLGYPDRHDRIEAHSFDAEVKDGKIELLFSGGRGASNNRNNCWYINGLIIEKRAGDRAVKSPDQIIYALRDWRISEVYTDAEALGFDRIYPPEKGVGEKWYRYTDRNEGYARISFADILRKNDDVVAYAKTFVKSDDEQFGTLRFGSTGRGKVWLNGELISVDNATHGLKPDEYVKKILLRQGWNEIMVKVCNNWGEDWAFTAALVPENRAVLIQDAGREVVGHISTIEYSSVKSFSTGPYSEGIADEKAKERFHESVRDGWTGDFSYDDGNTVEGERSFKVEAKRGQRIVVRNLFDAPIDISGYEAFECWIKAVNEKRETGKAEVLIQVGFGNAMYATLMPTAPSDTGFTITVSFPLNKWEKLYIPVPEKYLVGVYQILWYLSSQDADVTFYVDEIKLK